MASHAPRSAMASRVHGSTMASGVPGSAVAARVPGSAVAARVPGSAVAARVPGSAVAARGSRSALATRSSAPWRPPARATRPLRSPEHPPPLPFRCHTARDAPRGRGGGYVTVCLPLPCVSLPLFGFPVIII